MKAVIDTNVIVSAFMTEHAPPSRIVIEWTRGRFVWITSRALLAEAERVFKRRKIAVRTDAADIAEFLQHLRANATVVDDPGAIDAVVRGPDDNVLIDAAVAAGADYIVTGDDDLLSMRAFGRIEIVSPARFLALLNSGQ